LKWDSVGVTLCVCVRACVRACLFVCLFVVIVIFNCLNLQYVSFDCGQNMFVLMMVVGLKHA
jgi:hypothetical protein